MNTIVRKTWSHVATTALLSAFASVAAAANIPGLYNTGVLDDRTVAPSGSVDLHYTLVASADANFPGPSAYVADPIAAGYWLANSTTSRWIGPATNQGYPSGAASHAGGSYTYRISFDLTGLDPATASISGAWAADNTGTAILLNGVSTGHPAPSYNPLAAFVISSGFVAGVNTLDFVVNNFSSGGSNPTGLRVDALAGAANVASDTDGDGIADTADNCTDVANPTQLDADGDGYGNICDGDLNNSGLVTANDFNLLRGVLNLASGSSALAAAADMNGSGLVTATDFNLLRARINTAPGPSGLHP